MGYIVQPHTSAGRIPSDKGYRFYVDQIMQEKDSEVTEFKEMMVQKVDKLELVLRRMGIQSLVPQAIMPLASTLTPHAAIAEKEHTTRVFKGLLCT